ncbi:MAG: hypothetical protein EU981_00240 [Candidatus Liberibacter ctenarytainae]|uniref:Porin n=1 Tax=Candidatus Liberibacter ctenarytainae TaxID=2020335 RepID=A0A937ADV0_9HYPH|nr:hypothetical protein [Candidatus Liberibacter ctenarytainae]
MKFKIIFLGSAALMAIVSYSESVAAVSKSRDANKQQNHFQEFISNMKSGGNIKVEPSYVHSPRGNSERYSYPMSVDVFVNSTIKTALGPLKGSVALQSGSPNLAIGEAFVSLHDIKVGYYTPWGLKDSPLVNGASQMNSISFQHAFGRAAIGVSADQFSGKGDNKEYGIGYKISPIIGNIRPVVTGGYEISSRNMVVRATHATRFRGIAYDFGAIWSSGRNHYYDKSKYSIVASGTKIISDKVILVLNGQYLQNLKSKTDTYDDSHSFGIAVGGTLAYKLAKNIQASITVQHQHNYFPKKTDVQHNTQVVIGLKHSF